MSYADVRKRFVRRDMGETGCPSGRHRYEVVHRVTGRKVGELRPWVADFTLHGCRTWNAYTAAPGSSREAINPEAGSLEDALADLLNPEHCRPPDQRGPHENDLKPDEAGSRLAYPEPWEFYDWLRKVTADTDGSP